MAQPNPAQFGYGSTISTISSNADPQPPSTRERERKEPMKMFKSVDYYRKLVGLYLEKCDFETALFWADKVVTLSNAHQQDVFRFARILYLCGQYLRAVTLLETYKYERTNLRFRCLTAKCLYMAKDYTKALDILDLDNTALLPGHKIRGSRWQGADQQDSLLAQVYLLRGKIFEILMNRGLAADCYKEALHHDVYCYEAFHLLTQHQMLTRREETCLFDSLPFSKFCVNEDTELLKHIYSSKLNKYPGESGAITPTELGPLKKNLDMITTDAERSYYHCDFNKAYSIACSVIVQDPFHTACMPIYIALLIELNKSAELFMVSHRLIEVMPESALPWYAVGSYYFLIGKHENCRRNLNKALSIDPVFGPAWLLFGHSFATENEHDQAMASYFKATQLMRGCHLPMLHVGLECGVSNNPLLAMKFLQEARVIAPKDPFIHHEMGVLKFQEKKYAEAKEFFMDALGLVEGIREKMRPRKWEPLYNNLGHVCRKLKEYNASFMYHEKALLLCPSNPSTYSAIGLLQAVSGQLEAAAESFHKSLSLKRDDAFSSAMFRHVLDKLVEEGPSIQSDDI